MDCNLCILPATLRKWVNHGDPKAANQLVDLVKRYTAVEDLLNPLMPHPKVYRVEKAPRGSSKTVQGSGKNYKTVATDNKTVGSGPGDWPKMSGRSLRLFRILSTEHIICYHCHVLLLTVP